MINEFKLCNFPYFDSDDAFEFGSDLENRLMEFFSSHDISFDDYYSISSILCYWSAQLDDYYFTVGGSKYD